ncbi:DUF2141 domain-containing protein [Tenacibaculum piscium]|uniref:DUF2141 domain-containing protein n=1 Tax=Tenacibaculum piscium TaxID=1458515 RepID=UPI001F4123DC|nr:DUF2141 domain-containing protein [Tenacibaculum piscium]
MFHYISKIILIFAFFFSNIAIITSQEKHTLTLGFEGMKSSKGNLYIALYNAEKSFLKTPFKGVIVKIIAKKASAEITNIPTGTYAVSVFHDENENEKMDTNFLGIPKEPTGISNNAKGFMGPPKYKDAKFDIIQPMKMSIRIK